MKILKIELQNINSLKSDTPIVIDFENDTFKDVGLFAITGSTGAGKTTILDAITIAMYHNVPRFNKTKGSLIDVVSYGANSAFSRVTFLNNDKVYEAFWGIRLTNKSGKRLKKTIEEVSLKNLTDNRIITTKKGEISKEVERITLLNYNQFLRSVMLAQGEFASFLSAKGSDKGKLLEQITGEEIYKRIGEQILLRKNSEEKKLEDLKAKINNEDILSEEDKMMLLKQNKEIEVGLKSLEKELQSLKQMADWYLKLENILKEQAGLETQIKQNEAFAKQHQPKIELLQLHQQAEPFKEIVNEINRLDNEKTKHEKEIERLSIAIEELVPKIATRETNKIKISQELKEAQTIFKEWLPKFDEISKLDEQISNTEQDITENTEALAKFTKRKTELSDTGKKLEEKVETINQNIKNAQEFVKKHQYLTEIDAKITNWNTVLTTLKNTKEQINELQVDLSEKNSEIEQVKAGIKNLEKEFFEETKKFETLEDNLKLIKSKIEQFNTDELIPKKDKLSKKLENLNRLKNLSERYIKNTTAIQQITEAATKRRAQIDNLNKEFQNIETQIEKQNRLIESEEENLMLKRSIKNYEEERKHLVEGKACPLCGSTEHPFAKHLDHINLPESEQKMLQLKKELKELEDRKNKIKQDIAVLKTHIDSDKKHATELKTELLEIEQSKNELALNFDLSDTQKIDNERELLKKQLENIAKQIKEAQNLQSLKEHKSKEIDLQKESVHHLKLQLAKAKEKLNQLKQNVKDFKEKITELKNESAQTEAEIAIELSVYNYSVPKFEDTLQFIAGIEKQLQNYQEKKDELTNLTGELSNLKIKKENNSKQITETDKQIKEHSQKQERLHQNLEILKKERIKILPFNISIEEKRQSLQQKVEKLDRQLDELVNEIQNLQKQKNNFETLLQKHKTDLQKNVSELTRTTGKLNRQLEQSQFNTKQEVEKALLSQEDKKQFTQIEKQINDAKLQIRTLTKKISNEKEQHLKLKNFDFALTEIQEKIHDLTAKKESYLSEKGEIKEKFNKDKIIKSRNQGIYNQIKAQENVCNVWRNLLKVLGGSKDAFNTYVQRLTLKQLLDLANVHLYRLNKRYSLKMEDTYKPKEELNFNLIDHYQTGQARLVDTSSGGEKFIISLALALGLSDLASKNVKIDSLFIDEGFGTLDNETLETVISTLETLQSQGKIIGIISHVENLKERIPKQIVVTKKSNGVSSVEIR